MFAPRVPWVSRKMQTKTICGRCIGLAPSSLGKKDSYQLSTLQMFDLSLLISKTSRPGRCTDAATVSNLPSEDRHGPTVAAAWERPLLQSTEAISQHWTLLGGCVGKKWNRKWTKHQRTFESFEIVKLWWGKKPVGRVREGWVWGWKPETSLRHESWQTGLLRAWLNQRAGAFLQ